MVVVVVIAAAAFVVVNKKLTEAHDHYAYTHIVDWWLLNNLCSFHYLISCTVIKLISLVFIYTSLLALIFIQLTVLIYPY